MTIDIQRRLLDEFGGLFKGGGTELEGFARTDGGEARTLPGAGEELRAITTGLAVSGVGSPSAEDGGAADGSGADANTAQETARALGQLAGDLMPANYVAATVAGSNTHGGVVASGGDNGTDGSSAGSIASTFLESGLGIVPLISGLLGLFGGGPSEEPALEKYTLPQSISFESAESAGGLVAADFDQTGAPRPFTPAAGGGIAKGGGATGTAPTLGDTQGSHQITVNVQAMDAQSFLDYSGQIAQAVRSAMLNLSSLNDVVSEL